MNKIDWTDPETWSVAAEGASTATELPAPYGASQETACRTAATSHPVGSHARTILSDVWDRR